MTRERESLDVCVLSLLSSHMLYLPFSSVTCRFFFVMFFFAVVAQNALALFLFFAH